MIRQKLKSKGAGSKDDFRFRGSDPSRIEALSDTVFGFAITLLVISLSPPASFAELQSFLRELPGFAISVTFLLLIWYEHYQFFFKYGLRDKKILILNALLLLVILYYVYPLKFLFSFLTKMFYHSFQPVFTGEPGSNALSDLFTHMMPESQFPSLQIIFGLGAASVYIVFALMYASAWQRQGFLKLNKYEAFHTRYSIYENLMIASVPLLSCLIAFSTANAGFAGICYALYGISFPIFSKIKERNWRKTNSPIPEASDIAAPEI